jgi:hypothetical protein
MYDPVFRLSSGRDSDKSDAISQVTKTNLERECVPNITGGGLFDPGGQLAYCISTRITLCGLPTIVYTMVCSSVLEGNLTTDAMHKPSGE